VTRKEKEEAALLTVLSIFIGAQVMEKGNERERGNIRITKTSRTTGKANAN